MLKRVKLKNFVNFKEIQTLEVGEGVFTVVGANGSGKSTVFEAIRRCSEVQVNDSISSRKEKDEYSLAMCLFKKPVNDSQTQDNDTMVSYYMVWRDQEGQSADSGSKDVITFVAVKVLVTSVKNESDDHYLVWSGWNDEDEKVSDWKAYQDPSLDEEEKKKLLKFATCKETNIKFYEVGYILMQIHQRQKVENKTELKVENKSVFDHKFQDFTDIEFLLHHRGIGPIQSSQQLSDISESLQNKESRYKRGTEDAYVIRRFLEKREDDVDDDVYDKQIKDEEDVFRLITSESYKFTLEDTQIFVEPEDTPLSKKAPLLKVSEGIVEAKCISILLSKKGPRTLILEEPGHGMHKNYVDSMVNKVFLDNRFTSNKTIILSTHNRDFLTPKTLRNTFFCRRNAKGESVINQLTKPHDIETQESLTNPYDIKTLAFFSSADVSTIFFSKRTLFVEGKSDYMFVTMIKEILLQGSSSTRLVQKICRDDEVAQDKFKDFLATLNIISAGGAKEIKKAEEICKKLEITSRLFLIDGDQMDTFRDKLGLKEGDDDSFVFLWKCKCPDEKKQKCNQEKSDYTFVTMIKEILHQYFSSTCGDDKDKFNDFLATIHNIIDQGGAKKKKKAEEICKDLGLTSKLILIDGDQRDTFTDKLGLKEGDNDKKAEEEELHPKKEKHESRPEEEEKEELHPKKEKHKSRPEEEAKEELHPKKEKHESRPEEEEKEELHPKKEKHEFGDLECALLNLKWTHNKKYHRPDKDSCEVMECKGMRQWPFLKFKQTQKKAFLQSDLTEGQIYSGMKLVIELAVHLHPETEVMRFLNFLKDMSEG